MTVIARFKVSSIDLLPHGGWPGQPKVIARRVNLSAVKGEPFGSATPQGNCVMLITNPDAADQFEIEGEYEVTFTKVGDGLPVKIEG